MGRLRMASSILIHRQAIKNMFWSMYVTFALSAGKGRTVRERKGLVCSWQNTRKEPDLQGLPKGDLKSERALIGDADLGTNELVPLFMKLCPTPLTQAATSRLLQTLCP